MKAEDRKNYFENSVKLLGQVQVAAYHAATLATAMLDNQTSAGVMGSAPAARVVELGTMLLTAATQALTATTACGQEIEQAGDHITEG